MSKRLSDTLSRSFAGWLVLLSISYYIWKKTNFLRAMNREISQQIMALLELNGFKNETAKLVLAQFAHETGNFKSKLFIENNNPAGMKLATKRPTTAITEKNGHAYYFSLKDAVRDYRYYWLNFKYPETFAQPLAVEAFVSRLKENAYFEDNETNYLRGVKSFYNIYFQKQG